MPLSYGNRCRYLVARQLDRVREIHIAGGSEFFPKSDPLGRPIRRDAHNNPVPEDVLQILPTVLDLCPNIEAVMLERQVGTLGSADQRSLFLEDFIKMKRIVEEWGRARG